MKYQWLKRPPTAEEYHTANKSKFWWFTLNPDNPSWCYHTARLTPRFEGKATSRTDLVVFSEEGVKPLISYEGRELYWQPCVDPINDFENT